MVSESVDQILSTYAHLIRTLMKQIKTLDKGIEEVVKTMPEAQHLLSIPGVRPVYNAEILAEIGQIERFNTARKFIRLVDTLLHNHQIYTSERSV